MANAVTSGVRRLLYWLEVDGTKYPCLNASANQTATKQSATFNAHIAMSYPGAQKAFAELGENKTKLVISVGGQEKTLVDGEIDTIEYDYVARTLICSGRDKSAKLHQKKTAEKFNNKKPDEIVKDLAGRVGLEVDAASSELLAGKIWQIDHAKLTDGVSFASVIHKIAEQEGLRWWVKDGKLVLKEEKDGTYNVRYFGDGKSVQSDAMQIRIRRNVQAAKTGEVNVKSWSTKKKKVFEATATVGGAGGTTAYQYHVPGATEDSVKKIAKSKAKEHARHELTVSLNMVGDPAIDIAMKLNLTGTDFDQPFDIDSISHSLGPSGYTMSISAKSAKKGREAKVSSPGAKSAAIASTSVPLPPPRPANLGGAEAGSVPSSNVG